VGDIWSEFEHDPRDPAYASMRASDRDRDVVVRSLGDAYADGRLTREEYDDRADSVVSARTLGELPKLLSDLLPSTALAPRAASAVAPADLRTQALEKYAKDRREAAWTMIYATTICVVIWLATGGVHGFPWPLFVLGGTGLNFGRVLFMKNDIVNDRVRTLERRAEKARRKELEGPSSDSTAPDTFTPDDD